MNNPLTQILANIIEKIKGSYGGQQRPAQSTNSVSIPQQQAMLRALIQNTMAQTVYTPQTQQYLNTLPVKVMPSNVRFYNTNESPGANYNNRTRTITVNPDLLKPGNSFAVEALRHEYNHALDSNLNPTGPMEPIKKGPWAANSYEFMPTIREYPQYSKPIERFLVPYNRAMDNLPNNEEGTYSRQYTQDLEGFAQFGTQGDKTLGTPLASFYKNIFAPQERPALNYSPIFPTHE
jgi:hypothetical protein